MEAVLLLSPVTIVVIVRFPSLEIALARPPISRILTYSYGCAFRCVRSADPAKAKAYRADFGVQATSCQSPTTFVTWMTMMSKVGCWLPTRIRDTRTSNCAHSLRNSMALIINIESETSLAVSHRLRPESVIVFHSWVFGQCFGGEFVGCFHWH